MIGDTLRRVAVTAGQMLLESSFRNLRQQADAGVWIERIGLSGCSGVGRTSIRAEYQVRTPPGATDRTLVFDLRDSPMQVEEVQYAGRTLGPGEFTGVAGQYLRLDVGAGMRWSDHTITLQLRARSGDTPAYLIGPDWLPMLLTQSSGRVPSPRISLADSDTTFRLAGGICLRPSETTRAGHVQAVLSSAQGSDGVDTGHVTLATGLVEGVSTAEVKRIGSLFANLLDFFGQTSGIRPRVRLVVSSRESIRGATAMAYGALLPVSREELGLHRPSGGPSDFALAHRVAGVWWGGTCRLSGLGAYELQGALRGALALLWLDAIHETGRLEAGIAHLQRLQASSAARDTVRAARGLTRKRSTAANTLLLFRALRSDSRCAQRLHEVTRSCAGNIVPTESVRAAFLELGVALQR